MQILVSLGVWDGTSLHLLIKVSLRVVHKEMYKKCLDFCLSMISFKGQFKGLFTWSGEPRSSGVGFFCFRALGDTKQKKPTPLDLGPPLHVNRV